MTKGPRTALLAALFGAALVLPTPGVAFGAPPRGQDPPAAGADKPNEPGDSHAGRPEPEGPKKGDAGRTPKGDGDRKDSDRKDSDRKDGDRKDGDRKDGDRKDGDHRDGDDNGSDYDGRYGYHGHHDWETHRRYYRYGYGGPGWYDDCGYYGPDGYDGYYSSRDACDGQYGADGASLRATMSGDQEPGGAGAPDSHGTANLSAEAGRLCYRLGYDGISRPTAAHVHRGGPGEAGPVVIDLHPEANGDEGCAGADPGVLSDLQQHPEAFYVNLHTPDHRDGAMRGQLFRTGRT